MNCFVLEAMKKRVEEANERLLVAWKEADEAKKESHDARWSLITELYGVKPGSIVRCGDDVFSVSGQEEIWGVSDDGTYRPLLYGFKKKPNGAFMEVAQFLFDEWEMVPNE